MDAALESRIAELEARISFQEQAINELSDALAQSRIETGLMAERLRRLLEDLSALRSASFADGSSEPPPPHY